MHNLEFRLGKLDGAKLKSERPGATLSEHVEHLAKSDRLSGIGITNVSLSEKPSESIQIETLNPSVKGSAGAAKSFVFAWWAGALTSLVGRELDVNGVEYSESKNLIKCRIVPR